MKEEEKVFLKIGILFKALAIYLLYNALKNKGGTEQTLWLFMAGAAWLGSPKLLSTTMPEVQ